MPRGPLHVAAEKGDLAAVRSLLLQDKSRLEDLTQGYNETPLHRAAESGHAEVVRVMFDPARVSYETLLDVFWGCHDPRQLNRQGPDFGTQYRTAIYYLSPEQEAAATASKERNNERFGGRIVTEITPASEFWRAEDYHQQYFEKQGGKRFGLF